MRRCPLHNVMKWTCATLAALLLLTSLFSIRRHLYCWVSLGTCQLRAGFDGGTAFICLEDPPFLARQFGPYGANSQPKPQSHLTWWAWRWPWNELHNSYGLRWCRLFHVPFWAPVLVAASASFLFWRASRRAREDGATPCTTCAYDRRGLTPDAKCPECGTVPALPSK